MKLYAILGPLLLCLASLRAADSIEVFCCDDEHDICIMKYRQCDGVNDCFTTGADEKGCDQQDKMDSMKRWKEADELTRSLNPKKMGLEEEKANRMKTMKKPMVHGNRPQSKSMEKSIADDEMETMFDEMKQIAMDEMPKRNMEMDHQGMNMNQDGGDADQSEPDVEDIVEGSDEDLGDMGDPGNLQHSKMKMVMSRILAKHNKAQREYEESKQMAMGKHDQHEKQMDAPSTDISGDMDMGMGSHDNTGSKNMDMGSHGNHGSKDQQQMDMGMGSDDNTDDKNMDMGSHGNHGSKDNKQMDMASHGNHDITGSTPSPQMTHGNHGGKQTNQFAHSINGKYGKLLLKMSKNKEMNMNSHGSHGKKPMSMNTHGSHGSHGNKQTNPDKPGNHDHAHDMNAMSAEDKFKHVQLLRQSLKTDLTKASYMNTSMSMLNDMHKQIVMSKGDHRGHDMGAIEMDGHSAGKHEQMMRPWEMMESSSDPCVQSKAIKHYMFCVLGLTDMGKFMDACRNYNYSATLAIVNGCESHDNATSFRMKHWAEIIRYTCSTDGEEDTREMRQSPCFNDDSMSSTLWYEDRMCHELFFTEKQNTRNEVLRCAAYNRMKKCSTNVANKVCGEAYARFFKNGWDFDDHEKGEMGCSSVEDNNRPKFAKIMLAGFKAMYSYQLDDYLALQHLSVFH